MKDYLLAHSMAEFFSLICPILEVTKANAIAELSAKDLENAKYLQSWLTGRQGKLMILGEDYSAEFQPWLKTTGESVAYVPENSLTAIERLPAMDAWFMHGDPNWFTVYHELQAIYSAAKKHQKPMLVFIQDVAWPCAKRDWYPLPDRIPENFRHPFSHDYSNVTDDVKVMQGRAEPAYAYALTEGGEKNGVLTAVEDFVAGHANEFFWGFIPSIFGLGVLFDKSHPQAPLIAGLIAPYHQQPLLANLEKNRIANYLMTYDLKKSRQTADRMVMEESANFAEMDVSVKRLLEMLDDDADHPEIWNIFKMAAESDGRDSLIELANYINELLEVSQPANAVRILTIAHAVCAAYLGNSLFACKKLEELVQAYPASSLAQGALARVKLLEICHT